MTALKIFIIALCVIGLVTVAVTIWLFISNILDEIKRLIRNLKRKCPRCNERVNEKDLYCKHCGRALFSEVEE